jgi:eukaryotic-like serine/threonine-protein kinase
MVSASKNLGVPGYAVMRCIGSGARSTIWQIRQLKTGQLFALKRVVRRGKNQERYFNQVLNEVAIGQELDHPAIRKIHHLRRIRRLFSVSEMQVRMELCEGKTLQEHRPESIAESLRLFVPIAEAIHHMNAAGFVHADLKPNNIIVTREGDVKIIDLGQSCRLGTIKERIQGTPDYIAPEQVQCEPLDARTDVFNFGATMYWVLTGKPIPTVMPGNEAVKFKNDMRLTPPDALNPEVSKPLSKLVLDCVELAPRRRPQNMQQVAARLKMCATALEKLS